MSEIKEGMVGTLEQRLPPIDDGAIELARLFRDNPRRLEALELLLTGDFKNHFGGEIVEGRGHQAPIVYWHGHGIFIGPDGSMYHPRTDDNDQHRQVIVSPAESFHGLQFMPPFTYDGYTGPHSIEMRFDFVNGQGRAVPRNTHEEMEYLRTIGADPIYPMHKLEGDSRRDSLRLVKHPDGSIDGWLNDGSVGKEEALYRPEQVLMAMQMLDAFYGEIEEITGTNISKELGKGAMIQTMSAPAL